MSVDVATFKKILRTNLEKEIYDPIYLIGPPGIGKTNGAQQVAQELGIGMVEIRLSQHTPDEVKGVMVPDFEKKVTTYFPIGLLPNEAIHGKKGILFLDELPAASQLTMLAAQQLMDMRQLGNYVLPKGWLVVSAGNRMEDRAFVNKIPSQLVNRLTVLEVAANVDSWTEWAFDKKIDDTVVAFVRFKRELFSANPPITQTPFPTPRAWVKVSKWLNAGLEPLPLKEVIRGQVGDGAAVEFVNFLHSTKDAPKIVANILKGKFPGELGIDIQWAVVTALVQEYMREPKKYAKPVADYGLSLSKERKEFSVVLISNCGRLNSEIADTESFDKFCDSNPELFKALGRGKK